MSYKEYDDLYEKAQGLGKYHIFLFDIKGSRNLDPSIFPKTKKLLSNVYGRLVKLESETGKKILYLPKRKEFRGDSIEPIHTYAETIGFTTFRDSIQLIEVLRIWEEEKMRLNIEFDFHFAEGDYETDDWELGNKQYFRGYCIAKLDELSKKGPVF